jgi:serine/threonine protein phosphatase PrpC
VFDGHGGAQCAIFLKDNLHIELKKCFLDEIEGIKDSHDLNESLSHCIMKAFEITDTKF